MAAHLVNGYASLATVDTDFLHIGTRLRTQMIHEEVLCRAAFYLPPDGRKEKVLGVSVNMISDKAKMEKNRHLPGVLTTTAVRLLHDRMAKVKEAVEF